MQPTGTREALIQWSRKALCQDASGVPNLPSGQGAGENVQD